MKEKPRQVNPRLNEIHDQKKQDLYDFGVEFASTGVTAIAMIIYFAYLFSPR